MSSDMNLCDERYKFSEITKAWLSVMWARLTFNACK